LKQLYFYVAATLEDIFRRFQKEHSFATQLGEFEKKNAIHLHETHAAIGILEMLRLLIDLHDVNWQNAWNSMNHTFTCAMYNIKESQMEKWPVDLFGALLPRHLEILNSINFMLIEKVKKYFPPEEHQERIKRISIFDESTTPKMIRMSNLCLVACHKITFCSEMQYKILFEEQDSLFRDFPLFLPQKCFMLIPNGGNPRRWIYNANRKLADLITEEIKDESEWLVDLRHLESFVRYTEDIGFLQRFLEIRA
jgi:glycogen phosphorylase